MLAVVINEGERCVRVRIGSVDDSAERVAEIAAAYVAQGYEVVTVGDDE